jgi:DNA polymerase-3 subunit beta
VSSSSSEAGESEDSVETVYQSDPLIIGFNSQYLLDFFKAATTDEIRLELKDPQSAGQLRPSENGDADFKYRYVVMPMRI